MSTGELSRSQRPSGLLLLVPAVCVVALGWLVAAAPPVWAFAAIAGVLFLIVFLQRPDVGLLVALVVRSFTDLSISHIRASAPGEVYSSPLNIGLILIVIVAGGIFLLSRGTPLFRLPGGTSYVVLALIGLVGFVRAVEVAHTEGFLYGMEHWLRIVSVLIVYALAAEVFNSAQHVPAVIKALAMAFLIPALFGFYQIASAHGGLGREVQPITGTFAVQGNFAVFLVFMLGVFLCYGLAHSGLRRAWALGIVGASVVLLVATYARTAWVGVMIFLLVIGVLKKRVFLVLAPLVAVIAVIALPSVSSRLEGSFSSSEGSFADRLGIWRTTGPAWLEYTSDSAGPVSTAVNRLIGTGPGSSQFLVSSAYGMVNAEHNDFLTALFEYGIIGLTAYLALYLAIWSSAYRTWRRCTDEETASLPLAFLALIPSFMVMSLTDVVFGQTQNQIYFWTLAGLTVAISRRIRDGERTSPKGLDVGPTRAHTDLAGIYPSRISSRAGAG